MRIRILHTLEENLRLLVRAHRTGNWERAKKLSQERQALKKQMAKANRLYNRCSCGRAISWHARGCRFCWLQKRRYRHLRLMPS